MLLDQLVRPFGYLAIKHPYKWIVDWLYPFLLAAVSLFVLFFWGSSKSFISSGNGVSMVLGFVQSLPGFYIAALAAIATFGRPDIDEVLPAPTPKFVVRVRGVSNKIDLTRRRFLAMMFAFLTAESILLTLLSIAIVSFSVELSAFYTSTWFGTLFVAAVLFFFFILLFQMVLATFWGLYYLGHKLHEA